MNQEPTPQGHVCLECRLETAAGGLDCQAAWEQLLARDYEQAAEYWQFHRLAVDAYSLQHPALVASGKSFAAHLCGLCVAFDHGNDRSLLIPLQRWLSDNPPLKRPEMPSFRGQLNIGHVMGVRDHVAFGAAVEAWGASVWQAYEELQPLARGWLAASRIRSARSRDNR